jgi:UDP-N-acetyl-D-mannosaminuronate dehydrogenase
VNDHKAVHVRAQVAEAARAMPGAPITCFGLAFKPDVADLRESPALEIARGLAAEFPGRVVAVEPHVAAVRKLQSAWVGGQRCKLWMMLVIKTRYRAD